MKRSILSICILLASVSLVFANIYKKYDVRSGLSGNCVRSILQDSIGYMWFATQDGLNRFNVSSSPTTDIRQKTAETAI